MKTLTTSDLERMYCDFLDELYGECKIAGYEYSTSQALVEVDPTAFRCGFSDWISSELEAEILGETETGEYFIK